jgi:hypothetical protein
MRYALAREGQSLGTWLDEIAHSLEVDDQVAGHPPLLLPGEDAGEVLVGPQRPVGGYAKQQRAGISLQNLFTSLHRDSSICLFGLSRRLYTDTAAIIL